MTVQVHLVYEGASDPPFLMRDALRHALLPF